MIDKSRYDTTDCYINICSAVYNDIPILYDDLMYQQLLNGGVDEQLAKHVAHMFIRDPLQVCVIYIRQQPVFWKLKLKVKKGVVKNISKYFTLCFLCSLFNCRWVYEDCLLFLALLFDLEYYFY